MNHSFFATFAVTHILVLMNIKPGRYRHFKGNEYEVVGIAKDSETMEEVVVYRALYGERGLWVRSAKMFTEVIERDGRTLPRFQYVGD
jgi:cyclomaltodextrinase / maltogenic alpha-amylase / neopullulanase